MKDNPNPLEKIFIKSNKGEITEEIKSIESIPTFFTYLKDKSITDSLKKKLIKDFIPKLKVNRYIAEYFSKVDNKSVYLVLFDIYLNEKTSINLQEELVYLMNELRINVYTYFNNLLNFIVEKSHYQQK